MFGNKAKDNTPEPIAQVPQRFVVKFYGRQANSKEKQCQYSINHDDILLMKKITSDDVMLTSMTDRVKGQDYILICTKSSGDFVSEGRAQEELVRVGSVF